MLDLGYWKGVITEWFAAKEDEKMVRSLISFKPPTLWDIKSEYGSRYPWAVQRVQLQMATEVLSRILKELDEPPIPRTEGVIQRWLSKDTSLHGGYWRNMMEISKSGSIFLGVVAFAASMQELDFDLVKAKVKGRRIERLWERLRTNGPLRV